MAWSVESAFTEYYNTINLDGDHRTAANTRRDDVLATLKGKGFKIEEAFATGSIPKFTALREHADVDVMVALDFASHVHGKTPSSVLRSVRDALAEWRTNVRRNGQAVTLHYSTWPNVDIVPVYANRNAAGEATQYNVPNSHTDKWIPSRPRTHAMNISAMASGCGANFRRVIKMFKHWNIHHGDYLQSYHIEVLALKACNGAMNDTSWDMFKFFDNVKPLLSSYIYHDVGLADEYLAWDDRQAVLERVGKAVETSRDAWYQGQLKPTPNIKEALRLWRVLFGKDFPEHG